MTRQKRGQAFETMMLVISVIVAVAILGILLGFLGGIGTFGANANTVMPDLVKKVTQKGYGLELRDKVEFTAGAAFYRKDIIGEAAVAEDDVKVLCAYKPAADTLCTSDATSPITVNEPDGTTITVNKKITGVIGVCYNPGNPSTTAKPINVIIGRTAEGVRQSAEDACALG